MLLVFFMSGCEEPDKIKLGMSPQEVIKEMGQPDSKSILDGKVLRKIDNNESSYDLKKYRLVYTYKKSSIQVWFLDSKVTSVTKNGVSIL